MPAPDVDRTSQIERNERDSSSSEASKRLLDEVRSAPPIENLQKPGSSEDKPMKIIFDNPYPTDVKPSSSPEPTKEQTPVSDMPAPPQNPRIERPTLPRNENEPVVRIYTGNDGKKVIERTWPAGPQQGEREVEHANGTKIHYKPDGKGGEIAEETHSDGTKAISHAYPDGKGGVTVEHSDLAHPEHSYKATYGRDGSLVVDWKDGNHMERSKDRDGNVITKMTGPKDYDNFTAVEYKNPRRTEVKYADGSSFTQEGDKLDVRGRFGGWGILDALSPSASGDNMSTRLRLISAYWMDNSALVSDVRGMRR